MFRNSGFWGLAMLVAAALAFWPSYLSKPFSTIDLYTHVHAVVLAIWCLLLIIQPLLIRAGNRPLHRALGKLSIAVAAAIVVVTLLLIHHRLRGLPPGELAGIAFFFYLPLSFIALFAVCFAFAIGYRRRQTQHAAFMLATALTFIDPVLSRIFASYVPAIQPDWYQLITFATIDALLAIIVYLARGRALVVLVIGFGAVELGWFVAAKSHAWLGFVTWYRDLPLT